MNIEELVNRAYTRWPLEKNTSWTDHMRAALTEQAEAHALELRAYEATVQNLEQRIRELESELSESREQAERRLDTIDKLQPLARRVLWMAFVWNDHNFTHPLDYAREEAKKAGLNSHEDAQKFLSDVAMLAAAPKKEGE